jgi:NAD(P)-dependent dehydrogenase (short-subunit alcohol dehydrogenase family)
MAGGLIGLSGGEQVLAARNPNRRLGKPEDIAGLVVFLSSRASSHINGATITVDGGEVLARGGMIDAMKEDGAGKSKL